MTRGSRAPDPHDDGGGSTGLATELGRYAGFGLTLGLATAAFAWFGAWLDGRLHTEPLFVIVGAFVGFAGGFYSMYWRLVLHDRGSREGDERRGG